MEIEEQRYYALLRVNNTAAWAKGQLKILSEMAEDRFNNGGKPLENKFLMDEASRIANGIEIEN